MSRGVADGAVRLVFITSDLGTGGAERHAVNVVTGLDPARVQAWLLCVEQRGTRFAEVVEAGIPAASLDAGDRWWLHPARTVSRAVAALRSAQAEVVMTNGYSAEIVGRLAGRRLGLPVLVWKHNVGHVGRFGPRDRVTERIMGRLSTGYLAVSHAQVGYLVDYLGVKDDIIHVIHNSVRPLPEPDQDVVRALRTDCDVDDGAEVVLCAAGLRVEKDQALLLRAFVDVRRRRPDAVLLLAGDGPERGHLVALTAELGLVEAVRFLGNRDDVPLLMAAADVTVLASYAIENFPYAILESMAAGVPTVSTAVGGVPEMIDDGVTGLLVRPHDPTALADALVDLLGSPDRRAMGQAARHKLVSEFSYEQFLRDVEDVVMHERD